MTALAAERSTVRMGPTDPSYNGLEPQFPDTGEPGLEVAATTKIWAGSLVCRDASGNIVPGSVSTALVAIGCATETVDNTAGIAGAKLVPVRSGTFRWGNSAAGEAIAAAQIGDICYIVDDQTVSKTSNGGTRSPAGIVYGVDSDGVWVYTSHAISCLCIELIAQAALIAAGMQVQKRTVTFAFGALAGLGGGVKTYISGDAGGALPANARIAGYSISAMTGFDDATHGNFDLELGVAGAADVMASTSVKAGAAAAPKAGVAAGLGYFGAPAVGTFSAKLTGSVDLNTTTVGTVTTELFFFVKA